MTFRLPEGHNEILKHLPSFRKTIELIDERILGYLITKSRQLKFRGLSLTHQEIASELGSSREVMSRLLKLLEKKKLVELGRNIIYVRDRLEDFLK